MKSLFTQHLMLISMAFFVACPPLTAISKTLSVCLNCQPQLGGAANAPRKTFNVTTGKPIALSDLHAAGPAEEVFNALIAQCNVFVDFYADWCGPCQAMGNTLKQIAPDVPDIVILKVNTEDFPSISRRYNVRGIPFLICFAKGKRVGHHNGSMNKNELSSFLRTIYG